MRQRITQHIAMWGLVFVAAAGLLAACGSSKSRYAPAPAPTTLSSIAVADAPARPHPAAGRPEDLVMTATDFRNIHAWTKVRDFYVGNLRGHLPQALAVARDARGGTYPVGTIIQLIPTEAMVKRRAGWNTATHDWEFFSLGVSRSGTRILSRGATKTVNFLGLNCASCHGAARPQFDETCGHDHGCAPLPLTPQLIASIQAGDPRP